MSTPTLPPITTIPTLPAPHRAQILDTLFEPSTQLHTLSLDLLHTTPFTSYPDLIAAIGLQLTTLAESASTSDTAWLHAILGSHPRLGEKKVESAQSAAEQAQLSGEGEALGRLNGEYEERFPGLRYVVFVDGRGREEIMRDMRERIEGGDVGRERAAAIRAMCEIAVDRAAKLSAQ